MARHGCWSKVGASQMSAGGPTACRSRARASVFVLGAIALALGVPLAAAAVAFWQLEWVPTFDLALIEQRVRDVGTVHTPLLGLPGRLGLPGEPAHHPGPLSFYLLAPVHRLLGDSPGALAASAVFSNVCAVITAVVLARRSPGAGPATAVGLGLAVLMQGYGLSLLAQPWNPYFPVLWFSVFLVAIWLALCGDWFGLPVAAAAGSLCAQTHVPYVAVCGGIGAIATAACARVLVVKRDRDEKRRGVRAIVLALGVCFILWLPPIVEEITSARGNVTRLVAYFSRPPDEALGVAGAIPLMLQHLDAWYILFDQACEPGGFKEMISEHFPRAWRGAIVLGAWGISAIVAFRLRSNRLLALHGLVAAALVVAVLAVSRIFGGAYHYLMLWAWSIGVLAIVACLCTVGVGLPLRHGGSSAVALVALVVLAALRLTLTAPEVEPAAQRIALQLPGMMPPTIDAIDANVGATTGRDGCYLVTWSDPAYSGAAGFALFNELERAGFCVGVRKRFAPFVGKRRTLNPRDATARIHLATGRSIRRWRRRRRGHVVEVAFADPRSRRELAEVKRLRAQIIEAMRADGRKDAVRAFRRGPEMLRTVPGLSLHVAFAAARLHELGGPAAIFVAKR